MIPQVIIHNQISLDGGIAGFDVDMAQYYGLSYNYDEGFRLFGSETVLRAVMADSPETELDCVKPDYEVKANAPFWVIADSRGRIRNLHLYRRSEYCKDIIVLVSPQTPKEHLDYLNRRDYDYIMTGSEKVDFREALNVLNEKYGCDQILTDTGGLLACHLLSRGLVSKISLIQSPVFTGIGVKSYFSTLELGEPLKLETESSDILPDGCVHTVYNVMNK